MTADQIDQDLKEALRGAVEDRAATGRPDFSTIAGRADRRRRNRHVRFAGGAGLIAVAAVVTVVALVDRGDTDRDLDTVGPTPSTRVELPVDGAGNSEELPLPPLEVRGDAALVWTGTELVVWGGDVEAANMGLPGDDRSFDDGAAYDPATRIWRVMSPGPLPAGTSSPVGAMTDQGVVLVRGTATAIWDPTSDTWRELERAPRPVDDLMAAGGSAISHRANARLDLETGRWVDLPDPPLQMERSTTAWTGDDLIVVGGPGDPFAGAQAIAYNVADDAWRTLAAPPSDLHTEALAAAWDDSRVVVVNYDMRAVTYDPVADVWRDLPHVPARFFEHQPSLHAGGGISVATMPVAVVVLGTDDLWIPLPTAGFGAARFVSTGTELFAWNIDTERAINVLRAIDPVQLAATPATVQVGLAEVRVPAGFSVAETSYSPDPEVVMVRMGGPTGSCTITSSYTGLVAPDVGLPIEDRFENGGFLINWYHADDESVWRAVATTSDLVEITCDDGSTARALASGTIVPDPGPAAPLVYFIDTTPEGPAQVAYSDLVSVRLNEEATGSAERIAAALEAASRPTDEQESAGIVGALFPEAVPTVTIDGSVAILDWRWTDAQPNFGIWSTSSGSTGLNPIFGMVYENAPEVQSIENRIDGSCERYTEVMQGVGCSLDQRSRWEGYKDAPTEP
jgi:hypothetical protein